GEPVPLAERAPVAGQKCRRFVVGREERPAFDRVALAQLAEVVDALRLADRGPREGPHAVTGVARERVFVLEDPHRDPMPPEPPDDTERFVVAAEDERAWCGLMRSTVDRHRHCTVRSATMAAPGADRA